MCPRTVKTESRELQNNVFLRPLRGPYALRSLAHPSNRHYRTGTSYGDCLTKCGSAFESTLKVLCERNDLTFERHDTAGKLLPVVIENSTLESFFEQPLMLVATIRNRLSSSHGGGSQVRAPSRQIARYTLTSTAAAIVLLVETADVSRA